MPRLGRNLRDDEIEVLEGWADDRYGIPIVRPSRDVAEHLGPPQQLPLAEVGLLR